MVFQSMREQNCSILSKFNTPQGLTCCIQVYQEMRFQIINMLSNSDSVQANTLGGIQIHQNKVHFKILKIWEKKTTELHLSLQIKFTKRENTLIKFSPTSCQNTTASPASIQIGSYQQSSSCTTSLPVAVPTQS